nr:hypothetical protein CFP56_12301 [Quercus suber]
MARLHLMLPHSIDFAFSKTFPQRVPQTIDTHDAAHKSVRTRPVTLQHYSTDMAPLGVQRVFFSNDQYEVRHAKSTEEFKSVWWDFMIGPSRSYGMILLIDKIKNVPVGHVGAIVHSNKIGWISAFVIDEAHRGKGLGRELFRAAMIDARDNDCRMIGLDAVAEQRGTYGRRGFIESQLGTVHIMSRPLVVEKPIRDLTNRTGTGHIVSLREVPQSLLVQHELKYTGLERGELWTDRHMFGRPDVAGYALVTKKTPESVDDILAWALTRRCFEGFRIGPLYAQNEVSAKVVLEAVMETLTPERIRVTPLPKDTLSTGSDEELRNNATLGAEVWGGNADAVHLFETLGWLPVGMNFHRMWVDDKCTPAQGIGGNAQRGAFAMFDAGSG